MQPNVQSPQDKENIDIRIGEIFNQSSEMLKPIFDVDCNKAYSAFQYLEAIYLITHIVDARLSLPNADKEINIAFVLPNDENKYYNPENAMMIQEDIRVISSLKFGQALNEKKLNVSFIPFGYKHIDSRPYLDGKTITSMDRSYFENQKTKT